MQLVPAELREKAGDKAIEIAYKRARIRGAADSGASKLSSCHDRPKAEEIKKKDFPLKHSGLTSEIKARILGISLVILWLLVWEGSVQLVCCEISFYRRAPSWPSFIDRCWSQAN